MTAFAIIVALVIGGALCMLVGYGLGRMRGGDPPERIASPLRIEGPSRPSNAWSITYEPPVVAPVPERNKAD